ncbi:hypothetical protein QJQ45_030246, partial [Haematococcus lacustris]
MNSLQAVAREQPGSHQRPLVQLAHFAPALQLPSLGPEPCFSRAYLPARWPGSSIDSRSDYHCCSINGSSAALTDAAPASGAASAHDAAVTPTAKRNPKRVRPPRTAEGQQEDTRGAELGAGQASY